MNNGELKAAIVAITHRDDYLAARAAFFIDRARDMICSEVRALEMVTVATLTDANRAGVTAYDYTLPADFLQKRTVTGVDSGGNSYQVQMVSLSELARYRATLPPYFGAVYGGKLQIRGTPGTGAAFTLMYYAKPAVLSGDADTNTLLSAVGDLYLHGALFWAYLEEQALELAQQHKSLFSEKARLVNIAASRAQVSGAVSIPVFANSGGY